MDARTPGTGLLGSSAFVSQSWLVRLRALLALGGAALLFAAERFGGFEWPTARVLALLALVLASNVALAYWLRSGRSVVVGALASLLALDVAVLTGVLALTGGAANPFSSAYLIPIAVGALLLPPAWCAGVLAVALAGYSFLYWSLPADPHAAHHGQDGMNAHLLGMWVAFVLVGPMMAYAVTRLRRAIAEAETRLAESVTKQTRAEKLASLATLSAGAAHELATPLATIAVVAKELERRAQDPELTADARLIREEIDRCSAILSQLAVDVGAGLGEAAESTRLGDLLGAVAVPASEVRLRAEPALLERRLTLPRRLCTRALEGLVKNARQASSVDHQVLVKAREEPAFLIVEIEDRGCGMDDEVRRRAGEPFFTTKAPGAGMGLGLFFARSVFEHLGGGLSIESAAGRGTSVAVKLPWTAPA